MTIASYCAVVTLSWPGAGFAPMLPAHTFARELSFTL